MLFRIEMELAEPVDGDLFRHRWQIEAESEAEALLHARDAAGAQWNIIGAQLIADDIPRVA